MRYSEMKAMENKRAWRRARVLTKAHGGVGERRAAFILSAVCAAIALLLLV